MSAWDHRTGRRKSVNFKIGSWEPRCRGMAEEREDSPEGLGLSLVAQFDQLVRNRAVLAAPDTEQRFLEFVQGAGRARQRWEHAELECQRLAIELTRSSQEVSLLEARLAQARGMLEAEGQARRRAEQARDLLADKFAAVQRLVLAEGPGHALHQRVSTLLGAPDPLFDPVILPDLPAGDRTEDSVYNVSQLSFDDTMDLCQDSPLQRPPSAGGHKRRSRSLAPPLARLAEEPTEEHRPAAVGSKRRRSRSAGPAAEGVGARTRSHSIRGSSGSGGHQMVQKTVLKSEKCGVCAKRMKFGKIGLRCISCRLTLHTDCGPGVEGLCGGPGSPTLVSSTPEGSVRPPRTPRRQGSVRKQIFASPMLR